MCVTLGVIDSRTGELKGKILLNCSLKYRQVWSAECPDYECCVRLGNKYLKLNIIITQSGPNTDMAHKDLQGF